MENQNLELLFEYLRDILYAPKDASLDLSSLEEPYQKLGQGLQVLEEAIQELNEYSAELSIGILSGFEPSRDNPLTENLKNIHSNLNHLTWQAKQVAKGDYTQHVSYLGEFSVAFNEMTKQLKEREEYLKAEAQREKSHAELVESYNQLVLSMISRTEEEILVTSLDGSTLLYHSRNQESEEETKNFESLFLEYLKEQDIALKMQEDSSECTWEICGNDKRYFCVTTSLMEWQGNKAYAHILREVTEEKVREEQLTDKAYRDSLTGIGNRHYFEEQIAILLAKKERLTFCYCDLDHLKYVNDRFGHSTGDQYLKDFVHDLKNSFRANDIFTRLGGDEFCIILRDCTKEVAERKFLKIQKSFSSAESKYPRNFSFGIMQITDNHENVDINQVIKEADRIMYLQKIEHHKNRE